MMRIRTCIHVALVTLGVLTGVFLVEAVPASAEYGPATPSTFGSTTLNGTTPAGLGIDQASSHTIYVADENGDVYKFKANGEPAEFTATKTPEIAIGGLPYQMAVDNSTGSSKGDLYVAELTGGAVAKITEAGAVTSIGGLSEPAGVAVDSAGNVYVSEFGSGNVLEFSSSGTPLNGGAPVVSGLTDPNAIAIGPKGQLYVAEFSVGTVELLSNGKGGFDSPTTIDSNSSALGVTVEESTGDVFVDNSSVLEEFEEDGTPTGLPFGEENLAAGSLALAVNEGTHELYATNGSGLIDIFESFTAEKLNVGKTGTGEGTVTSEPNGINCGTGCAHSFKEGLKVILTAKPELGSKFIGWSGGGCSGSGTCTVTMSAETTVTAEFEARPEVELKVDKAGTGVGTVTSEDDEIECGATCGAKVEYGFGVTLTATPAMGSRFKGWSGGGCSGEGTCAVTMTADTTVTAEFEEIPKFKLSVSRSGSGSGDVASREGAINCGATCEAEFEEQTTVTLTAEPRIGSKFVGWSGGGCSGNGVCEVEMTAAGAVTAEFSQTTPFVVTEGASNTTTNTADVAGKVDPNHGAIEVCEFEYGPTTAYGAVAPCSPSPEEGTVQTTVGASLSGLAPRTLYHYRLIAKNAGGVSRGGDATFATSEGAKELAEEAAARKKKEEEETAVAILAAAIAKKKQEEAAAKKKLEEEEALDELASITIVKTKVGSNGVTVTVKTSRDGTVTLSGPGLKTTTKTLAAGTSKVIALFEAAGRRAHKHGKKVKLTVKLTAGKKTVSESKTIKL